MTLRELKNEVHSLSFISPGEQGGLFFSSVKRALSIIFCQLKITNCQEFSVEPLPIVSHYENLIHNGKEIKTLPLAGRAYSLRLSGKGRVVIVDGMITQSKNFDSEDITIRGFIENGGQIRFEGDFSYRIVDFATFSDVRSDKIEDIFSAENDCVVDMNYKKDFFSFVSANDENNLPIKGCYTCGTKLHLPKGFKGKVLVTYRRCPKELFEDDESIIDIPEQYKSLLALLVAAFTLTDDNPELSEKYMSIYDKAVGDMKEAKGTLDSVWVRTNGWA